MKVLIIGKSGQLAQELSASVPKGISIKTLGRSDIDITCLDSLREKFDRIRPNVVVNASAYTAVDKAESDKDGAYAVNDVAVKNLASLCAGQACRMLHVSTDFVFGEQSPFSRDGIRPLLPDAPVDPLGIYGKSKFAGEQAVSSILPNSSIIVRTAWVYSCHGNNFVKTMLRLMVDKPELGVIYDQIGTPTWAKGLAKWIWSVVEAPNASGVYHWTDAGVASWYDFAVAVQELAVEKGLLKVKIPIKPISSTEYPTPAKRPTYSVLNKESAEELVGYKAIHWRKQLSEMLDEFSMTVKPNV